MTDPNEATMRALAKLQAEGKVRIIGETVIHVSAPDGTAEDAFDRKGMVFAFPDPSPSFVHGFEAGMIWQKIEAEAVVIDCGFLEGFPVHAENLDVIARMAASRGYAIETQDTGYEGWVSVRLSVSRSPKPKLKAVSND